MVFVIAASLLLSSQKIVSLKKENKYTVTAYTSSLQENSRTGLTRMGHRAKQGTIAVDPRVIPMGSKIYVPGGVADDTGGAIKGRHIDICVASRHTASRWGRKKMDIIILPFLKTYTILNISS